MNKVHIITACWNNWQDTKELLDSIYQHTAPDSFEIIVINNGSTDETPKELFNYPKIHRLDSPINMGFSGGFNRGFEISYELNPDPEQFICIINNDIVVTPGWLEKLMDGYNIVTSMDDPRPVGYIVPLNNFTSSNEQRALTPDSKPSWVAEKGRFLEMCVPHMCLLFKRQMLNAVGKLDEEISPIALMEDVDYNWRLTRNGYRSYIDSSVFVYHKGSRSVYKVPNISAHHAAATVKMNQKHQLWEQTGRKI